MTLFEYFRPFHKFSKKTGRFGLEIETETMGIEHYNGSLVVDPNSQSGFSTNPKSKFWSPKGDGSLRNFGMEYVLKEPHDLKGVRLALDEFSEIFKTTKFLKNAPATSVHAHMNVQGMSAKSLGNLVVLWTLFENILVEYSGEPRRSNLFTLPMRCAEGNVKTAVRLFRELSKKNRSALSDISDDHNKYAALNLAALKRFCSVEIRCFRGETDAEEIYRWVSILDKLVEYAIRPVSPPNLIERYNELGFDLFFEVFGDHAGLILERLPDGTSPIEMIERNLFYSAVISDSVEDWSQIDPVFEHKPVEKKEGQQSRSYFFEHEIFDHEGEYIDVTHYRPDLTNDYIWTLACMVVNNSTGQHHMIYTPRISGMPPFTTAEKQQMAVFAKTELEGHVFPDGTTYTSAPNFNWQAVTLNTGNPFHAVVLDGVTVTINT